MTAVRWGERQPAAVDGSGGEEAVMADDDNDSQRSMIKQALCDLCTLLASSTKKNKRKISHLGWEMSPRIFGKREEIN